MTDLPPKPIFTRNISFGNVVQISILLVGLGSAWATFTADLKDVSDDVASIAGLVAKGGEERSSVESRVRALEIEAARSDERYSQLLASLEAIRSAIVRLENKTQ